MPVTVIVNFATRPGKREALVAFLSGIQEGAISSGCHSIAVHRDADDENKVFEVEYWDDKASHQAFVKAAADAGAFAPLDEILAAPFSIVYGEPARRTDR